MTRNRLSWEVSTLEDGSTRVGLQGAIDEDSTLAQLLDELQQHDAVRLNLSKISRINSVGVREWVNFVRALQKGAALTLEECSPVVVAQLNMIANFGGDAQITSVYAPYLCDGCGHELNLLVDATQPVDVQAVAVHPCPACGDEMELDDLPDSYFAFLSLRG